MLIEKLKHISFYSHKFIIVLILFISLLLRINVFTHSGSPSYYYIQPDYARDYLIANHIIKYHEFPLDIHSSPGTVGPPTYFYLLSFFLFLKNNIVFLGFINIFLQIAVLISIYLLARAIFNKETGLISLILYGLNPQIVDQSYFVWQPWVMQPFLLLSYLFLFLAYKKRNYKLLISSIGLFVFSLAIHSSPFALLPAFIVLAFYVLRSQKKQIKLVKYLGMIIAFIGTYAVMYFPLYLAIKTTSTHSHPASINQFLTNLGHFSLSEIVRGIWPAVETLLGYLFVTPSYLSMSIISFCFLILGISYLLYKKDYTKRIYFNLIICTIIYFCFIASIVPKMTNQELPPHYFTPIFSLIIIAVAELMRWIFSKNFFITSLLPLAIIIFFQLFYPTLKSQFSLSFRNFANQPTSFITIPSYNNPAIEAIKNEIWSIQRKEHQPKLNFFQIRTYGDFWDNYATPLLFVPLEQDLNTKLVSLNANSSAIHHLDMITSDTYIFVACTFPITGFSDEQIDHCLKKFYKNNNHLIVKNIYSQKPYAIFLAKKVVTPN